MSLITINADHLFATGKALERYPPDLSHHILSLARIGPMTPETGKPVIGGSVVHRYHVEMRSADAKAIAAVLTEADQKAHSARELVQLGEYQLTLLASVWRNLTSRIPEDRKP